MGVPGSSVGTTVDLRITLKSHRENALINVLLEVSDLNHSCAYAMLQVRCVLVEGTSCRACHSSSGHTRTISITRGGSWLTLSLTKVNALFSASYQLFLHTETNETVIRTIRYSLPAALQGHVQTVGSRTHLSFGVDMKYFSYTLKRSPADRHS